MNTAVILMLLFLIACAIAVCVTRSLLASVIIYMSFSGIMSIIWIVLESPDLAITEAAVGAGLSTILFILTLRKLRKADEQLIGEDDEPEEEQKEERS